MDKLKSIGIWVLARAEEPSTWAGAGGGAIALHMVMPGLLGDKAIAVAAAVGALLAVVIPENNK